MLSRRLVNSGYTYPNKGGNLVQDIPVSLGVLGCL